MITPSNVPVRNPACVHAGLHVCADPALPAAQHHPAGDAAREDTHAFGRHARARHAHALHVTGTAVGGALGTPMSKT